MPSLELSSNSVETLLQAASGEVEGGSTGSAAVRAAALGALRLLVEAVGSGDALAFFVPGLVSGLGKALAAAGVHHCPGDWLSDSLQVGRMPLDAFMTTSGGLCLWPVLR